MKQAIESAKRMLEGPRDLLVWAAAAGTLRALSLVPPRLTPLLAYPAGALAYGLHRRRRRIALRNLEIAFRGSLSDRERRRIARAAFRNLVATFAGAAQRGRWIRRADPRTFRISAEEGAILFGPRPRGLALLSAHLGDWEMLHHYLRLRGLPVSAVKRETSNRRLEAEIARVRSAGGARLISKRGALREIRGALRRGEAVGLLPDQNCPRRERFFEFFGVPASTYTEYARILSRSGCRVAFTACLREGPGARFRIRAIDLGSGLDPDEIVTRYLRATEDVLRSAPGQYLWMHRRWKSRPTGAPWLYGDLGSPLDPEALACQGGC